MSSNASRSPSATSSDDVSEACLRARSGLSAFIDGEASPDEADDVLSHMSRCAACQHVARGLQHLIAAIQRSHVPVLASRRLQLRVTQLFADQESRVTSTDAESTSCVVHADPS